MIQKTEPLHTETQSIWEYLVRKCGCVPMPTCAPMCREELGDSTWPLYLGGWGSLEMK